MKKTALKHISSLLVLVCFLCTNTGISYSQEPEVETSVDETMPAEIRSMSLQECVVYAVINSFEVKLAKLDLLIAETDLRYVQAVFDTFIYGGASYTEDKSDQLSVFAPTKSQTNEYYAGISKKLPTGTEVNLSIGDTRSWSNSSFVSKNPSHTAQWTAELTQPLGKNAFGFIDRKTVTITRLAIENADLETQDRIEELIAKTEEAYWDLVFAKRDQEIYYGMLDRAKKLYEDDIRRFDMGLIERVDLLNSEANLEKTKAEVLIVENRYDRAKENLKLIMNIEDTLRIVPEDFLALHTLKEDLPACLKEAFEKRRDYDIARRDVDIKGIDLKIKRNNEWPEIDLTMSMAMNGIEGKFNHAVGTTSAGTHPTYYAGVEVNFPLENSEAGSEYTKAKHEKERSIVKLKEVERTIITEVVNAYDAVIAYEVSSAYMTKAAQLQEEKLDEEDKRFKYGRSSTKRIIDYQRDLLRAQLEEAQFLHNHNKAKVALQRRMNTLLEKYEALL